MAPVLQCPDCGTKHPIAEVPTSGAFPCRGCGRVLKVPEVVAQRAAAPAAAAAAVATSAATGAAPVVGAAEPAAVAPPTPSATQALPVVERRPKPEPAPVPVAGPRLGRVPLWMRFLLWVVAVPLSFAIVFETARLFGFFTTNQLSDVFLANGTSRFWPVARLLPFVAVLTALIVQGGVFLIARRRGSRPA